MACFPKMLDSTPIYLVRWLIFGTDYPSIFGAAEDLFFHHSLLFQRGIGLLL